MQLKNSFKTIIQKVQTVTDKTPIPGLKSVLSPLFNLIEDIVSENDDLKAANQKYKDEINKLKGEQGKPDVNPVKPKDGDISSDSERKDAEADLDKEANRTAFRLSKPKIKMLAEQKVPQIILDALQKMQGEIFHSERSFIKKIELEIDDKVNDDIRDLLINYARYKKRKGRPKIQNIHIDKDVFCPVDKSKLPDDVVPKGYQQKIVQDIILKTDNTRFIREILYSPSLKKTFLGEVPVGYEGDYGPCVNANIISLKYVNGMTIPKINCFLSNLGLIISNSTISRRLTKPESMDIFHAEFEGLYKAALETSSYMQIDDTSTSINGNRYYSQIVCNDFYTLFFTTKRKDRLTILDILSGFGPRQYLLNEKTLTLLEQLKVADSNISLLMPYLKDKVYEEAEFIKILDKIFGKEKLQIKARVLEACAICRYREETGLELVSILVCDDAPQFKLLTEFLSLCWIHNGRHYKKLNPIVPSHQEELERFLSKFWAYYRELFQYKKSPTIEKAGYLSQEFDRLFSTETSYDDLNKRISKSKSQKGELLTVLIFPEIPLHNNASELGAREEKRRQDISLQTITLEGTKAKDTAMSIGSTCVKLGINTYNFIFDRVSGKMSMPSLAEVLRNKWALQNI